LALSSAAAEVHAQVAEPGSQSIVHDAAFYVPFAPQTALDIVERTPGFVIDEGEQRRGLAGTAGNVLIDGRPPALKSLSLREALARIPANRVVSVHLLSGSAAATLRGGGGEGLVANVLLSAGQGEGTWTAILEAHADRVSPRGGATWSGRWRGMDLTGAAERYADYRAVRGGRRFSNAQGLPTGSQIEVDPRTYRQITASGAAEREMSEGSLSINGRATRWTFRTAPVSSSFDPAENPTGASNLSTHDRETTYELGADWERGLGSWTVESIALARRVLYSGDSIQRDLDAAGGQDSALSSQFRTGASEYVVRSSLARSGEGRTLEWGGEAALNTLSSRLAVVFDIGDGPTSIAIPAANVDVEEWRGELFVNMVRPLGPVWSLDGRLAIEASRLTVSGDASNRAVLVFFKPAVQFSRQLGNRGQLRFSAARTVEQLDFNDFAGAAQFEDDRIEAGNPELLPEAAWRLEARYDRRFASSGTLALTLFHAWISDAADRIPVGETFDAPGNIGDGRLRGVTVEADVPLDQLGPGLRATANVTLQTAEVSDPLTGIRRTQSNFQEVVVQLGLRQDVPRFKLAWGLDYTDRSAATFFRRAQIERYDEGPFVTAFVERTFGPARVRLSVENLSDQDLVTTRTTFNPDRLSPPSAFERRVLRYSPYWVLELKGSF